MKTTTNDIIDRMRKEIINIAETRDKFDELIETIEEDLTKAKAIKRALAFTMNEFIGLSAELKFNVRK